MFVTYFERVYKEPKKFSSNVGSRIKQLYSPLVDEFGTLELVESGVENLYEYIQSFKDEVDLNVIIARFTNGDVSALSKHKGFFADVSELPKSYAEFLNVQERAKDIFNSLSVSDREKFDFDVNKFIASFGTDRFLSVFLDKEVSNVEADSDSEKGVDVNVEKSE